MFSMFELFKPFDSAVSGFFSRLHTPFFDGVMPLLTDIMTHVVLIILFLVIFVISKKKNQMEIFWAFIVSALGSLLFSTILKQFISRPRPLNGLVDESMTYSFPSDHSSVAFGMYGFIIFLVYRSLLSRTNKFIAYFVLSLCIIFVGFSRLYLGVHHASDIIGGYIIGLFFVLISTKVVRNIEDDTV